jgi:hypothetical protein
MKINEYASEEEIKKKIYDYYSWVKNGKEKDREVCDPKKWLVEEDEECEEKEECEEDEEEPCEEDEDKLNENYDPRDWLVECDDNEEENKLELPDPITCFIDAYDICGPTAAVVEEILRKKNSERTEVDKEIIRRIVRASKPERPKIIIERMEENEVVENTTRDRVAL